MKKRRKKRKKKPGDPVNTKKVTLVFNDDEAEAVEDLRSQMSKIVEGRVSAATILRTYLMRGLTADKVLPRPSADQVVPIEGTILYDSLNDIPKLGGTFEYGCQIEVRITKETMALLKAVRLRRSQEKGKRVAMATVIRDYLERGMRDDGLPIPEPSVAQFFTQTARKERKIISKEITPFARFKYTQRVRLQLAGITPPPDPMNFQERR